MVCLGLAKEERKEEARSKGKKRSSRLQDFRTSVLSRLLLATLDWSLSFRSGARLTLPFLREGFQRPLSESKVSFTLSYLLTLKTVQIQGARVAQSVKQLTWAQVMNLGS